MKYYVGKYYNLLLYVFLKITHLYHVVVNKVVSSWDFHFQGRRFVLRALGSCFQRLLSANIHFSSIPNDVNISLIFLLFKWYKM